MRNPNSLNATERLQLQQLLQLQYWGRQNAAETNEGKKLLPEDVHEIGAPEKWELTRGIKLEPWQRECVESWISAGGRGVLKVVTGAGKTILALAIAQKLQQTIAPELRVAIVVPTIVLLNQWREELGTRSNLPKSAVGLLGGGFDQAFDPNTRVLISVLNTAARKMPELVDKAGVAANLLLIVDECHRAGATEMQRVLRTKRAFSLGLSATPERELDMLELEDDASGVSNSGANNLASFEETTLGRELGPVVFEMDYAAAVSLGVLPPFGVVHYGLSLAASERIVYDRISREVTSLRQELERPGRRGLALMRWCRSKGASNDPSALRFLALTSQRKRLLFQMEERANAAVAILRTAFSESTATKAILFHESIEHAMALFARLRAEGFPVVAEHSQFPDSMRAEALDLFRSGTAQVIVSAKSLIEGFNVPSADLGIVVAATSSVRQRVQTLGRLLRKPRDRGTTQKNAKLYVLYAADTVDEAIYEKADWDALIGAERSSYYLWPKVEGDPPIESDGPPRRPIAGELSIDANSLLPGETYPGNPDEGREYTRDSQGTVRTDDGALTIRNEQLLDILRLSHKASGRFRVTPVKRFVTELRKSLSGWQAIYLGALSDPITEVSPSDSYEALQGLKPGDEYPIDLAFGRTFSVLQRDPRLIARKFRGQVTFVIAAHAIANEGKRRQLHELQQFLKSVYQRGHKISKIIVNAKGHVVYLIDNKAIFAGLAPEGPEGFIFEAEN